MPYVRFLVRSFWRSYPSGCSSVSLEHSLEVFKFGDLGLGFVSAGALGSFGLSFGSHQKF